MKKNAFGNAVPLATAHPAVEVAWADARTGRMVCAVAECAEKADEALRQLLEGVKEREGWTVAPAVRALHPRGPSPLAGVTTAELDALVMTLGS